MGRLDTKRMMRILQSDKRKQEAAATQQASPPEKGDDTMELTRNVIDESSHAAQLTSFLSDFNRAIKEAQAKFDKATADEQYHNSAIQDVLHVLEFAPQIIDHEKASALLAQLREKRRLAKIELEVTRIFNDFATTHAKSLNVLTQVVGNMNKVLERQPNAYYLFKTDVLGRKNTPLDPEVPIDIKIEGEDE